MGNSEYSADIGLYTILTNSTTINGKTDTARDLFNSLSCKGLQPDVKIYTTMINVFCQQGSLEEANGKGWLFAKYHHIQCSSPRIYEVEEARGSYTYKRNGLKGVLSCLMDTSKGKPLVAH